MRTIGRHWPSKAPINDYAACCDFCGVRWRRSQLRVDEDGRLRCPDEGDGMSASAQAKEEARASKEKSERKQRLRYHGPRGTFDKTTMEDD